LLIGILHSLIGICRKKTERFNKMKLRDLSKMQGPNNGTRTLNESIMIPEIIAAIKDWMSSKAGGVLIGGLALSNWAKPRMTQDIDVLYLHDSDIPDHVNKFKKTREHSFQHNSTHVEVETVSSEFLNLPEDVVQKIIDTAINQNGIKVASPSGIVASKLYRFNMRDQADIVDLINSQPVDISDFNLPEDKVERFRNMVEIAAKEK